MQPPASNLNESPQRSNKNSNNFEGFHYIKVEGEKTEGPSTSSSAQVKTARRSAGNWDYLYGENAEPSMIIRRHSTSSYSSNSSEPSTTAKKQSNAKETTPGELEHDENQTEKQLTSVEAVSAAKESADIENATKPSTASPRAVDAADESRSRKKKPVETRSQVSDTVNGMEYRANKRVSNGKCIKNEKSPSSSACKMNDRKVKKRRESQEKKLQEQTEKLVVQEKPRSEEKQQQQQQQQQQKQLTTKSIATTTKEKVAMATRARAVAKKNFAAAAAAAEKAERIKESIITVKKNASSIRIERNNVEDNEKNNNIKKSKDLEWDIKYKEMLDKKWNEMFKGEEVNVFRSTMPDNWLNFDIKQWQDVGDDLKKKCTPKIMLRQYGKIYCICLSHILTENIYSNNYTFNVTVRKFTVFFGAPLNSKSLYVFH